MSSLVRPIQPGPPDADEAKVRLLACGQCGTLEELDTFDGPPEYDVALNTLVSRHQTNGHPHAPAQLFDISAKVWKDPNVQEQVAEQIKEAFKKAGHTGLPDHAYTVRNTFIEDAHACWRKHLRTPDCSDYKTDQMQIVPDTAAERREMGMPKFDRHNPRTKRYLCEYCPVDSLVQQKKRDQAGLYDK